MDPEHTKQEAEREHERIGIKKEKLQSELESLTQDVMEFLASAEYEKALEIKNLNSLREQINLCNEALKDPHVCPCCRGHGSHTKRDIVREDGQIKENISNTSCLTCSGTGKLGKPNPVLS